MVIDTSALLAILLAEKDADQYAAAIASDSKRLLGCVSHLETALVIEARKGTQGGQDLDLLLHRAGILVVPFDSRHVEEARRAYARFGKGRHPAGLNLGDCCTYGLSAATGEPILFKGDDFARTDAKTVKL